MKCINKKRKKVLFLKLAAVIIILFVILGIVLLSKDKNFEDEHPYNKSIQAFGTSAREDALVAPGLSRNLCVGEDFTQLEGIQNISEEMAGFFSLGEGTIPFSNHLYEKIEPRKVTQLMTALLAVERLNLEDEAVIEGDDRVYGKEARSCGLQEGYHVTVKQLLNAVLVSSAEDACQVLARLTGGSQEAFVTLMNERATELGMTNTHYANSTGYTSDEQYTTVYDIYLLLNEFLKYPDLLNAMSLPDYTINYTTPKDELKQRWLDNDNPFTAGKVTIPKDVTVLGGKTFTSKSNNYAALLTQNKYGEFYISIVFHAETESALMERMSEMLSQTNR